MYIAFSLLDEAFNRWRELYTQADKQLDESLETIEKKTITLISSFIIKPSNFTLVKIFLCLQVHLGVMKATKYFETCIIQQYKRTDNKIISSTYPIKTKNHQNQCYYCI